ncbi:molybdopterin-dependent oxidoreductase [Paraburkholderia phosphatilytica]|uniref:molybdopterin-dependent oxidoreductase n=1 Tax=Paraburkholderia phosphatilytica TaxID=2282883 RepID=UPI000E472EF2|nr:molybdopterin-dependent oxidoreductase [Paraburkholderia phosphatilytica]
MSLATPRLDNPSPLAIDGMLAVTGAVIRPLALSVDELRGFACAHADGFDLRCYTSGRFIRQVGNYRGVLLKELIDKAGLRNEKPGDFKRTVFIAVAHDGYAVTFSWHELFNTPVGERALVACECDGKPLSSDDGAPILFSGGDIVPAPRHVKRLARVVVQVLSV